MAASRSGDYGAGSVTGTGRLASQHEWQPIVYAVGKPNCIDFCPELHLALIARAQAHLSEAHPGRTYTREQILFMAS